ncbi:MAG: riboflavin biosynthesis protein RibF [Clostridiales bacterium]|jgi:riboflavin kinase/FMN adenylyltransferase|nr:riboflavin biosynthesis protein RibF [Clostridiales bacterium]
MTVFENGAAAANGVAAAVGLGNFDGLHLGHISLIYALTRRAAEAGLPALIYTFASHPQNVLAGSGAVRLLTDNAKKRALVAQTAVDGLYFEHFDRDYADMPPEVFARRVLAGKLNARLVAVGGNYRFGRQNAGTVGDLKRFGQKYGFAVAEISPYEVGGTAVSSSRIRDLLDAGRVEEAPALLGRLFSVRGTVHAGLRLGRTIGFPTANMLPEAGRMVPGAGVYITSTHVGGALCRGLTSVGSNPTVGVRSDDITETFLLDFSDEIYGETIEVFFHKRIRGIRKFPDLNALKAQIGLDADAARHYFREL